LMRHDGGNPLKHQDNCEKVRALPRNAMECGMGDSFAGTARPGWAVGQVPRRCSWRRRGSATRSTLTGEESRCGQYMCSSPSGQAPPRRLPPTWRHIRTPW
jgi:hypothetical protein